MLCTQEIQILMPEVKIFKLECLMKAFKNPLCNESDNEPDSEM